MAVQGRGYYGIGAAKKDFGFSKNMTLPLSGGYDWSQADPMPTEGRSGKGHASFTTVDKKGQLVEHRNEKKGKSWRNRLSGFFKREKKAKETEESGESGADSVKGTAKSKTKASEEPNLKEDGAEAGAQPEDDVNNAILNQEGLTTAEDEEQEENEEGGEQEDEEDDSDMVVAAEVEVEYHRESGDEDHSQVSLTEAQELEDIDPDMESNSLMLPAAEVQDDEEEIGDELEPEPLEEENENAEQNNEDIIRDEVEPEPLEEEGEKIDQNTSIEPDSPVEKIPPKQKKKKKKSENRKSAALDVAVSEQEGKKNGKTKKQRPKSMPVPTLDLANEQEVSANADTSMPPPEDTKKSKARQQKGATARTNGQDIQEATTMQPEIKKGKAKKGSGKKGAGVNDKASTESPVDTMKNAKAKKKSAPSEQTFDSPLTSGSPPPEEEIQVPKQVTVGVIKKKKQKTRPFLEVSKNPRSEVYQSDPAQEDDIEDPDAEEKELLHEMDTLQLMVGEETAKSKDKKAKKKKQGEGRQTQDTTESPAEVTKAAKKSKQAKGKGKSVAEPEPMVPQTEVATKESKEEKGSRVAKKTRAKGKTEPQIEPKIQPSPPQPEIAAESEKPKKAKKSKSGGKSEQEHEPEGQQTEAASKKQPKKKVKSKDKDDDIVLQVSPPEAAPEPDKREVKKTKKTKSKGKSEPPEPEEAQPPLQEVAATATEPDKKQPVKVKKAKSKGKAAPEPEPEALSQSPPPTEPESGKKRSSKKSKEAKGKGKTDTTNAPKAAAAENSQEESETPKKKKKKISKATPESPSIQNSGSSSARTSRSQLATKTSKSKIASEVSDDLEWVGAEKFSKKMSESEFKSKDDSAVDEVLMEMDLSISSSRSTSYHELSKDDRKTFQEELRKANSQHSVDAADDVEGSVKVEIDPNVKVTKSGVVKAGGKGSRRPSLQMQVFEGGIEQTDSASPNEADKESSKKISMDLSAVPQTTPSLGLAYGHDKVDLVHRSSVKRRPMSQRESTLLTEDQQNTNGSGAGLNSGQGTPTSVARQLFSKSDGEPQNGAGSAASTLERARRNKTVDKPVKMLGIASDSSAAKSVSDPSVPSWVALAKNKQKRSSQLLADKKEVSSSIPAFSPTPVQSSSMAASSAASRQSTPRDKDDSIPKMGTVQARLAAFQRK